MYEHENKRDIHARSSSAARLAGCGNEPSRCLTFSLSESTTCFISIILVQFTPSGFAASMRPPMFEGIHYKRWRVRAVLWFQTMSCYDATLGKPEGVLDAQQAQAFQKIDTLFKAAL